MLQVRAGIAIIPQEPVMFKGTVRSNLDPFCEAADDELWRALELVSGGRGNDQPPAVQHLCSPHPPHLHRLCSTCLLRVLHTCFMPAHALIQPL